MIIVCQGTFVSLTPSDPPATVELPDVQLALASHRAIAMMVDALPRGHQVQRPKPQPLSPNPYPQTSIPIPNLIPNPIPTAFPKTFPYSQTLPLPAYPYPYPPHPITPS